MDYKTTLNLPYTDFPMKANLSTCEPEILQRWNEMDLYAQMRKQGASRKKFILHDGPPYANGNIHIGHAVNKILKDIVVKSHTLSGFESPFIPGWDCHGLPIELNVEKKLGKPGVKISFDDFRKACRQYASQQIDVQRKEFKRLGVIGAWEQPYLTMTYDYEANVIRSLSKIIQKGHLHKGYKPVHWCIDCASALAEAEVEYEDKNSFAIDVRFAILDEQLLLERCHHIPEHTGEGEMSILIWTTTPWTLPANQAVAVNPHLEYVVVQCETEHGKERFVLAEALLKDAMLRYGVEHYRVLAYCRGDALEELKVKHPFYQREVPIILGDHVTTEAGTGAVHTAPAHGQDDYHVALKYKLPLDNPVGNNGCFLPEVTLFAGEHVLKANEHVIEVLKANNALVHEETIRHSYPHCWRHKTPLIFLATPQWFIGMEQQSLRRDALMSIDQVQWFPDWGKARIAGMVGTRPDWCISRKRSWGVPIALFIHKETSQMHPDTPRLMEEVAQLVEKNGIEAWYALEPKILLGNEAEGYEKISDSLDVWFESGVSHACVLEKNPFLQFPADLYLEGSDQHRGWFQSSLLTSVAMNKMAPYREVLTHGFTVDAQGRKMSKSLGNVIAPEKIVNTLGADILRLWVAATDYRGEIPISDEILKRIADVYRRLRNTARFLLANLHQFDPEKDSVSSDHMLALDRWIVDTARLLQEEVITAYDEYQFHLIYQKVHHFCSIVLGGFYLDIIKDRQYTMPKHSLARRSAQTAMYHIAEALVRWFAPILSFTAEEIWTYLPGKRELSVMLATWYDKLDKLNANETMNQTFWTQVIQIRDEVNKVLEATRNAGKIGSGLEAEVRLYCSKEIGEMLRSLGSELRFVFITSTAEILAEEKKTKEAIATPIPGLLIEVNPSVHAKCIRCWHRREDVGHTKDHPELCGRCVENVVGKGEVRHFA